jgi:preprotein translocase subunit SecG
VIESILWILFTLICLVLSGIILLQEGIGGGLGEAFGGAGQQTFGVKAQGIAKFTGWMAVSLVVIALVISKIRSTDSAIVQYTAPAPSPTDAPPISAPAEPAGEPDGN